LIPQLHSEAVTRGRKDKSVEAMVVMTDVALAHQVDGGHLRTKFLAVEKRIGFG
jgi:hypothetical protein